MRVTICGKYWDLEFTDKIDNDINGYCEDPESTNKKIKVRKSLKGKIRLDVLIHEMLHASDWNRCEESVAKIATDIAEVLWRLGYKHDE